jgi:tetratricopeptide (TPR) repeat protein
MKMEKTIKSGNESVVAHASRAENPGLICLALAGLAVVLFWPALRCGFVTMDDPAYFSSNPIVQVGLTSRGVIWAFSTTTETGWNPLTWLSYMLDVELFGRGPIGPHLTNLVLYVADTALLFLVLRQLTGALWRSAAVAALFAVHPLHVETVAWVSDRKDLLSTLFELLTLAAYARYAKLSRAAGPVVTGDGTEASGLRTKSCYYGTALVLFSLALMSKPMAVALPLLMLLLDWWPLGRVAEGGESGVFVPWRRLVIEKIPFLALSAILSLVTLSLHRKSGAFSALSGLSPAGRLAAALTSYAQYIGMTFWPAGLAVPYPYRLRWAIGPAVLAAGALAVACAFAVWIARRRPYVPVGWFWFVGLLLPVIGFVPPGAQMMADRYMFLPLVGILIVLVWGVAELIDRFAIPGFAVALALVVALIPSAMLTRRQLAYWKDSGSLFRHTLAVTGDNALASIELGCYVMQQGKTAEAVQDFQDAIRADPYYGGAYDRLGLALAGEGRPKEALPQYQSALRLNPRDADALANMGMALASLNDLADAVACFHKALEIEPDAPEMLNDLGLALAAGGRFDEAIQQYQAALQINPDDPDAEANMGVALASKGQLTEAIACYRKSLEIQPDTAEVMDNLGGALAAQGRFDDAIEQYRHAVSVQPGSYMTFHNLGLALAQSGRLQDAVGAFTQALRLNPRSDQTLFSLGYALAQQGRMDEAVTNYEASLQLNPANPEAQFNLGSALAKLGRRDDALAHLTEALRLAPDYQDASNLLQTLQKPPAH